MEFKLVKSKSNYKVINGWNQRNELIYNSLTYSERIKVDKILHRQVINFLPHERMSFGEIINMVRPITNEEFNILGELRINKLFKDLRNGDYFK